MFWLTKFYRAGVQLALAICVIILIITILIIVILIRSFLFLSGMEKKG